MPTRTRYLLPHSHGSPQCRRSRPAKCGHHRRDRLVGRDSTRHRVCACRGAVSLRERARFGGGKQRAGACASHGNSRYSLSVSTACRTQRPLSGSPNCSGWISVRVLHRIRDPGGRFSRRWNGPRLGCAFRSLPLICRGTTSSAQACATYRDRGAGERAFARGMQRAPAGANGGSTQARPHCGSTCAPDRCGRKGRSLAFDRNSWTRCARVSSSSVIRSQTDSIARRR
jgi:hypothetical protein